MLNVPLLSQSLPADCLPTCVEMVTSYYGYHFERSRLRKLLEFSEFGTPSSNINFVKSLGLDVSFGTAKSELPLIAAIERNIPPICFVETDALHYWQYRTGHALVVVAISPTQVVVNDPAFAEKPIDLPFNEFMLAWSDRDMEYALVSPA